MVIGTQATLDKYKSLLQDDLYSILYQTADNDSHRNQLRKTARKSKPNWNIIAWMGGLDVSKFKDLLAAYDWYLFLS